MTIDATAIQEQVSYVLDLVLPSESNASIVTTTGGTKNSYGESVDETEVLTPIFIYMLSRDNSSRITGAGNTQPKLYKIVTKATEAIKEGDRIRTSDGDFLVEFMQILKVGDDDVYMEGSMRRIHGD